MILVLVNRYKQMPNNSNSIVHGKHKSILEYSKNKDSTIDDYLRDHGVDPEKYMEAWHQNMCKMILHHLGIKYTTVGGGDFEEEQKKLLEKGNRLIAKAWWDIIGPSTISTGIAAGSVWALQSDTCTPRGINWMFGFTPSGCNVATYTAYAATGGFILNTYKKFMMDRKKGQFLVKLSKAKNNKEIQELTEINDELVEQFSKDIEDLQSAIATIAATRTKIEVNRLARNRDNFQLAAAAATLIGTAATGLPGAGAVAAGAAVLGVICNKGSNSTQAFIDQAIDIDEAFSLDETDVTSKFLRTQAKARETVTKSIQNGTSKVGSIATNFLAGLQSTKQRLALEEQERKEAEAALEEEKKKEAEAALEEEKKKKTSTRGRGLRLGGGNYSPTPEEFSSVCFFILVQNGIDIVTSSLVASTLLNKAKERGVHSLQNSMNANARKSKLTIKNKGGGRKQRSTRRSRN